MADEFSVDGNDNAEIAATKFNSEDSPSAAKIAATTIPSSAFPLPGTAGQGGPSKPDAQVPVISSSSFPLPSLPTVTAIQSSAPPTPSGGVGAPDGQVPVIPSSVFPLPSTLAVNPSAPQTSIPTIPSSAFPAPAAPQAGAPPMQWPANMDANLWQIAFAAGQVHQQMQQAARAQHHQQQFGAPWPSPLLGPPEQTEQSWNSYATRSQAAWAASQQQIAAALAGVGAFPAIPNQFLGGAAAAHWTDTSTDSSKMHDNSQWTSSEWRDGQSTDWSSWQEATDAPNKAHWGDDAINGHGNTSDVADGYALELLRHLQKAPEYLQDDGEYSYDATFVDQIEQGTATELKKQDEEPDAHALSEQISSAVQLFLAGDDCDEESISESEPAEPQECQEKDTTCDATASDPAEGATKASVLALAPIIEADVQYTSGAESDQLQAAQGVAKGNLGTEDQARTARMPDESPAPSRADIPSYTPEKEAQPFACSGRTPSMDCMPSPEGLQEFLSVLTRRRLPVELSEDAKLHDAQTAIQTCVQSLYQDRIRPILSHVQRRLRQQNCSELTVQALLPMCARAPETYRIIPPMHGEQPVILLIREPEWFQGWVDPQSPDDNYDTEVWESFHALITYSKLSLPAPANKAAEQLLGPGMALKARGDDALASLDKMEQLERLSLGELEHLIRLSIGKGLLKYHGDLIQCSKAGDDGDAGAVSGTLASKREQGRAKQIGDTQSWPAGPVKVFKGASRQTEASSWGQQQRHQGTVPVAGPTSVASNPRIDITDCDDLAVALLQIMQSFPHGMLLSQLKQQVQTVCNRNLKESTFKCTKLVEIFKLAPLNQIFALEQSQYHAQKNELVVKPPKHDAIPARIWQLFYHAKEPAVIGADSRSASDGAVTGRVVNVV